MKMRPRDTLVGGNEIAKRGARGGHGFRHQSKEGIMTGKTVRLAGATILLLSIVPAGGPVYLGIIRDDVHAHSRVGDLGLQAITVSGIALMILGAILLLKGNGTEPPKTP